MGLPAGVLTLDLGALVDNWNILAQRAALAECAAVIKANAYGIGANEAARALAQAGCRSFFVAQFEEAVRVRDVLPAAASIYVLNGLESGVQPADYVSRNLRPAIASLDEAARWAKQAPGSSFALHIDTGMNRLGFSGAEALRDALDLPSARASATLVLSHFIASERPDDPRNVAQIARFTALRALAPEIPASLANSSGMFLPQKPFFDLVRPGYALYGGNPTPGATNPMKPVVKLEAAIQQIRSVEPGESVGYNAQWTARRKTRLAVLLAGYADGLPRAAGATDERAGAEVMIAGRRCPLVGRVSMDLIVADVTDAPDAREGDMAEILGATIGIDEFAERSQTIGYTILTGLGPRYRRVYREA